jgi:hypothetical protein
MMTGKTAGLDLQKDGVCKGRQQVLSRMVVVVARTPRHNKAIDSQSKQSTLKSADKRFYSPY